jgi:hypothetical protein
VKIFARPAIVDQRRCFARLIGLNSRGAKHLHAGYTTNGIRVPI